MRKMVVLSTLVVALLLVNWSIFQKEQLLKQGETVYFKLAPYDPRSLMQGDYMELNYEMAEKIRSILEQNRLIDSYTTSFDGLVRIELDDRNVAQFAGLTTVSQSGQDLLVEFRYRNGVIKFATNEFFFEEGKADRFDQAMYGEFRLGQDGELLLVSLRDEKFNKLD
ncbi:GDYXXLXY domain-containing protein [Vibrio europaeus]|uniref:GDYXXLXY domain-containing protein n=1 Tax=Vibrio europaeus TaxID=300876 RepID=UPI00233F2FEF|nr:GDYXXLXY domain-containing protein [Vibrio europaeus]MDC5821381.1 GDYXXLXY domain-containing protein [Vibrio europaeus]MDC5868379.1 GDYXXLXY domain-containing protein [Vibrio europaeus]